MTDYYALINKLIAKPGKRAEMVALLLESGKLFQDNPACLLYLVYEDAKDPNLIWVEDLWTSQTEHQKALSAPAMQEYVAKAMPLLEGMPAQTEVRLKGGKGAVD